MYKMAYYHMKVVSLDANFKSLRIDDYLEDSIQWGFLLQNKNVKGHCIKINLWEINFKSSTRDSENPLSDNITKPKDDNCVEKTSMHVSEIAH